MPFEHFVDYSSFLNTAMKIKNFSKATFLFHTLRKMAADNIN